MIKILESIFKAHAEKIKLMSKEQRVLALNEIKSRLAATNINQFNEIVWLCNNHIIKQLEEA